MADTELPDANTLSFETALAAQGDREQARSAATCRSRSRIAIYERGEALKKRCAALLREAKERVEKIRAQQRKAAGVEPFDAN